jgi:hypothetical protein
MSETNESSRSAADRTARVVARRRLLEVEPSGVRNDLDAAAQCECGCHPRPGGDVHLGQVCPCQLTPAERRERSEEVTRAIARAQDQYAPVREEHQRALAAAAAELGVQATEEVPGAPWVLVGTVDGIRFTMRERWESYTVTIEPDEELGRRLGRQGEAEVVLAEGSSTDLSPSGPVDYRRALGFIVALIRTVVRRASCSHGNSGRSRYCPDCGQALVDPELPD